MRDELWVISQECQGEGRRKKTEEGKKIELRRRKDDDVVFASETKSSKAIQKQIAKVKF